MMCHLSDGHAVVDLVIFPSAVHAFIAMLWVRLQKEAL